MAELGIKNWNKGAKEGANNANKLSAAMQKLGDKIKATTGISIKLPSLGGAITAVKNALIAGTAAATGFFAAMTVKAGTIKELDTLSRTLGVTVENLQRWQFAAKSVGIESDKMADIFKDTSDKLGDFLTTGGGEAGETV